MSSRTPALQVVSMLSKKTRRRITQRLQSIRTRALLRISGDDCSTEETDGSTRDRRSNCHRQAGDEPCLRDPWRNDVAAIQVEWRDNRASRTSTSSDRRWRYCRPIGWRWPTRLRRSGSMAGDAPATTASSRKRTDLLFIELGGELLGRREGEDQMRSVCKLDKPCGSPVVVRICVSHGSHRQRPLISWRLT